MPSHYSKCHKEKAYTALGEECDNMMNTSFRFDVSFDDKMFEITSYSIRHATCIAMCHTAQVSEVCWCGSGDDYSWNSKKIRQVMIQFCRNSYMQWVK